MEIPQVARPLPTTFERQMQRRNITPQSGRRLGVHLFREDEMLNEMQGLPNEPNPADENEEEGSERSDEDKNEMRGRAKCPTAEPGTATIHPTWRELCSGGQPMSMPPACNQAVG